MAYISSWLEFELAIWEEKSLLNCQLASTVLSRMRIRFSRLNPNSFYNCYKECIAGDFVDICLNNVVVDVTKWALDANQVIFKDLCVHDIPLIVSSWTGMCTF